MAEYKLPTREELEVKYPSQKSELEKEPLPSINLGQVKRKKPSLGKRFVDAFFGKDIDDVGGYVMSNVVVPSIKSVICAIARDVPEYIFFGRRGGQYPLFGSNYMSPAQTSIFRYDRVAAGGIGRTDMYGRPIGASSSTQVQKNYMFDDIILPSAAQANTLRNILLERIERYGTVSVAEVNELLKSPISPTDYDWGWKNLQYSEIRPIRDGYLLAMPKIIYLK